MNFVQNLSAKTYSFFLILSISFSIYSSLVEYCTVLGCFIRQVPGIIIQSSCEGCNMLFIEYSYNWNDKVLIRVYIRSIRITWVENGNMIRWRGKRDHWMTLYAWPHASPSPSMTTLSPRGSLWHLVGYNIRREHPMIQSRRKHAICLCWCKLLWLKLMLAIHINPEFCFFVHLIILLPFTSFSLTRIPVFNI